MSTSTDGGLTWSTPIRTDGNDKGLGGQPVVQPSGRVIVPFESLNGTISAFHSDNGGASWSRGFKVSGIRFHRVAGGLRTSPLPSAQISAPDGGAHGGDATQLAGPMALSEIAQTSQGPMVGDYISTSFSGGKATTAFAIGHETTTAAFDEAMYAPASRLSVATAAQATRAASSAGVTGPITGVGIGAAHRALR